MLDICREKNIARDLKLFDLKKGTLPYDDHLFDHVIAVGLLHFFEDLEMFFRESHRILKEGGTSVSQFKILKPEFPPHLMKDMEFYFVDMEMNIWKN